MSDTNTLFPTTELMAAIVINSLDDAALKIFSADPKGEILANLNIDFADIDVNLIENSGNDVNLALPYYSEVAEFQAELLKDDKMKDISGGEIFASLALFFGTIGLAVGFGSAAAGITTGTIVAGVAVTAGVAATAVVAVGGTASMIGTGIHYANKKKGK